MLEPRHSDGGWSLHLGQAGGVWLAGAIVAVTGVIVLAVPVPPIATDLLLALSLGGSVGVLLVALAGREPARLSSMPPLLVLGSIGRIVLCLAISRLIIGGGGSGGLVAALGGAAAGGDPIAGLALLVVLAVVQTVMVTAGVSRMSEVAARFALDALPGKQMGLDTALSGGHLEAEEARREVDRLEREANFYGAMDGAGRLLRGEAVAAIVIIALTAAAGIGRSVADGIDLVEALRAHAQLATGQGLLTLLPALVSATAAALMVSRSASASPLIEELAGQLLVSPWPLAGGAVALLSLGLFPGVSKLPMILGAALLGAGAWWVAQGRAGDSPPVSPAAAQAPSGDLVLELGMGLLELTDGPGGLMFLLPRVRSELSERLGFQVPPVVVRDSLDLRATEYALVFRGGTLVRGTVRPGRVFAVSQSAGAMPDIGRPADLPDGRTGVWVTETEAGELAATGYAILTPQRVLAEAISVELRRHAEAIFDLERADELLRAVRESHPTLMREAESRGLNVTLFRRTCAELLWASIPLSDPVGVVAAICEALPDESDPEALALTARPRLAAVISDHLAADGTIIAVALAPVLEQELAEAVTREGSRTVAALPPARSASWVDLLDQVGREYGWGRPLAVVVEARCLLPLQSLCRQARAELVALQPTDLTPGVQIEYVARLEPDHLS